MLRLWNPTPRIQIHKTWTLYYIDQDKEVKVRKLRERVGWVGKEIVGLLYEI